MPGKLQEVLSFGRSSCLCVKAKYRWSGFCGCAVIVETGSCLHARQNIDGVAIALAPSLQAAEQGGSPTGVLPIKQNLQRLIKRGIAVNEATQTPNKVCLQLSVQSADFCCCVAV